MLFRRVRRMRRVLVLGVGFMVVAGLTFLAFLASDAYNNTPPPPKNYFAPADEYATLVHIVDTPSCHILNISAFHSSVLPLVTNSSSKLDCTKDENKKWTYVDGINQDEEAYDLDAYSLIEVSAECKPLTGIETSLLSLQDEFIRVTCVSKYWPFQSDTVYR